MRVLLGIVLGAILTVGAAYIHDSHNALVAAGQPGATQQSLVNWDVVSVDWQRLADRARAEWNRHMG